MLRDELHQLKDRITAIAEARGAVSIRLIGSVARGEERADSDVDFLVDFESGRTLFDISGLKADLEELLQRPVHLALMRSLKPRLRDRILKEAVPL
jgi:uncharacterized protein